MPGRRGSGSTWISRLIAAGWAVASLIDPSRFGTCATAFTLLGHFRLHWKVALEAFLEHNVQGTRPAAHQVRRLLLVQQGVPGSTAEQASIEDTATAAQRSRRRPRTPATAIHDDQMPGPFSGANRRQTPARRGCKPPAPQELPGARSEVHSAGWKWRNGRCARR